MLLHARVLGNYIPMKIHISETLWMRPKLLMDLSSSGYQCTLSANFKDQALWSVDLGSVFGIHHIIYYRTDIVPWGKYLKVYFFGCCCCWEDPSSGEFNIRKVKHCTVTSESQSSQVWHQVGPLLKPSLGNMSVSWIQMEFRYECCVIMKWWSFCE